MSITGILSGKFPVAKVVARDSYDAPCVIVSIHCIKFGDEMCP